MGEDLLGVLDEEREDAVDVTGAVEDVAQSDVQVGVQRPRPQTVASKAQVRLVVQIVCKPASKDSVTSD